MSKIHSSAIVGGFGRFVNVAAGIIVISMVGAGYFSALGSFAGVA
ncbi:MAG: hypothetical protein AAGB02_00635 [Pseudomonadota bacterium]